MHEITVDVQGCFGFLCLNTDSPRSGTILEDEIYRISIVILICQEPGIGIPARRLHEYDAPLLFTTVTNDETPALLQCTAHLKQFFRLDRTRRECTYSDLSKDLK